MFLFSQAFFLVLFFWLRFFQFLVVGCLRTDAINRFICLPDAFFRLRRGVCTRIWYVRVCVCVKVSARCTRRESQSSYVITAAESAGFSISSSRYIFQNTYFSRAHIQTPVCLCISKSFVRIVLLFRDLIYTHAYVYPLYMLLYTDVGWMLCWDRGKFTLWQCQILT